MKSRRWPMHLFYLFVIATLLAGILGMNRMRIRSVNALRQAEANRLESLERGFSRLCGELSGNLFSALEADTEKLYLGKLTEMQTAASQALLLLSEDGRQTPWITFWQSLQVYLNEESEHILSGEALPEDRTVFRELAEVCSWLSENPEVILDESTKSLPEGLKLPTLQTAYAVEEERTRSVANRVLGVRGGLTLLEEGTPGVRSYVCNNARVDVLQSGELLYFSLELKPGKGEIDDTKASEVFLEFAQTEGFGKVQITELYREDGLIRAKLAPLRLTGALGRLPDLDRTLEIACTDWSGKVCYFSAGKYFTTLRSDGEQSGRLLTDGQVEEIAKERGARIGPPFLYRGKICRPLIYERSGWSGRSVLCVDAADGTGVELFYLPHARTGETALY